MEKIKNFWKNLSTPMKIVLVVGILIVAVFIYDFATGKVSDLKGWMFDRTYTERMEKIQQLEDQNVLLRAEKKELERQAIEAKAKEAIFEARDKFLDEKTKTELDKLDKALEQQDAEEAKTNEEVDNFTRCTRMKDKMVALNIPSAKGINCDEYK